MRHTIRTVQQFKDRGERFAMLTAYDYPTARLLDDAEVPVLLVGDSLGMVVLGYESTLAVTLADMLHHVKPVVRGSERALVVADMPFMSYQISPEQALENAGRLVAEGGAQAVKLEGGVRMAATIERIAAAGIPVMGHLGLTPQSVNQLGGYRAQAKTEADAIGLVEDAKSIESAGAFSVVLEVVPAEVAGMVQRALKIPVIGIGSGPDCDGQVQVVGDILGMSSDYLPRHARPYAELSTSIRGAVADFVADVASGAFPGPAQTVHLEPDVSRALLEAST